MSEKELHPIVKNFLIDDKKCVDAKVGLGHYSVGYADAFGIKDIGGQFNSKVIGFAIEVKTSKCSFGKHIGQALGYSLFSHRCYLAIPEKFDVEHIEMANRLGVGLIEINNGKKCEEILTAQHHEPIEDIFLTVCQTLGWSNCNMCGEFFKNEKGWTRKSPNHALKINRNYYRRLEKDKVYYTKAKRRKSIQICHDCLSRFKFD